MMWASFIGLSIAPWILLAQSWDPSGDPLITPG
jgi:hypothetical protein